MNLKNQFEQSGKKTYTYTQIRILHAVVSESGDFDLNLVVSNKSKHAK